MEDAEEGEAVLAPGDPEGDPGVGSEHLVAGDGAPDPVHDGLLEAPGAEAFAAIGAVVYRGPAAALGALGPGQFDRSLAVSDINPVRSAAVGHGEDDHLGAVRYRGRESLEVADLGAVDEDEGGDGGAGNGVEDRVPEGFPIFIDEGLEKGRNISILREVEGCLWGSRGLLSDADHPYPGPGHPSSA